MERKWVGRKEVVREGRWWEGRKVGQKNDSWENEREKCGRKGNQEKNN